MLYRKFGDLDISLLGFGAMRLPVIDGRDSRIDEKAAEKMIDTAMASGINYYDTAWGYHGGNSELVVSKSLGKYPRDSYYFATKFPGYDLSNFPKVKEIFKKQLEKTGLDHFDFYLFHNVCEMNIEQYFDPKYGIYDYLIEQRDSGKIKHLGFSCHGEYDVLKRFLEAYGKDMEFCQLQINYLDWTFQHAKEKVELLKEYGIPVWVMEPVRGGKLSKLKDEHENVLKNLRPDESVTAWAFRFLQSIPEATVILSGMSNDEQLEENIRTFESEKPLTDEERSVLMKIALQMSSNGSVPCTACRYCVDHCPMELDIPRLISLYNEHILTSEDGGMAFIAPMAMAAIPDGKKPSACLHCRSCEAVCPQQIGISEIMDNFVSVLGM